MSMGSSSSADSGGGGMSPAGQYGSSGMGDQPQDVSGGIFGALGNILKDPRVVEAIGSGIKSFGSTLGKSQVQQGAGGVSPQIVQQASKAMQQAQSGAYPPGGGPYVGDASSFQINPQIAQMVLQKLGIPSSSYGQ